MKFDASSVNQRYLDEVVEHLARAGRDRDLIAVVERWAQVAQPSRMSRLLLVRAFLNLLLMDRAWLRIRELLEADPDDLDAVALAAEMFILRGWPSRARRLLEEAILRHPNESRLSQLEIESRKPPRQPPSNARAIEQQGRPEDLLELAERFLSTGSFLRTRTLLEKLRRIDPSNVRVQDLLWGLQGDFGIGDASPEELAGRLAPEIPRPEEYPEATDGRIGEEVTAARIETDALSGEEEREFPALFRQIVAMPLSTLDDDTGEVTQPVQMASREELESAPPSPGGDASSFPPLEARSDDTEIMMVIRGAPVKGGPGASQLHRKREQDYDLKQTLNLREYRAHMGMDAEEPHDREQAESKADFLEEEDEDRVVVTRREPAPDPATAPGPHKDRPLPPLRIIEKHPLPAAPPPAPADPISPLPGALDDVALSDDLPVIVSDDPASDDRVSDDLPSSARVGVRSFLLLGLLTLGLGMLFLVRWSACARSESWSSLASSAIRADSYKDLLKAEAILSERLKGSENPDAALVTSLARVETALWEEFLNNQEHLLNARELLAKANSLQNPGQAHLARGELALSEWRLVEVRAHLDNYGQDDADRFFAEAGLAALEARDEDQIQALENARRLDAKAVRPRRALVEALAARGRLVEAREVLREAVDLAPDNTRLKIAAERVRTREMSPMEIAAELNRLVLRLPDIARQPRLESGIYRQGASALLEMGESQRAWTLLKQAFAKDGTSPDLLTLFAIQALEERKLGLAVGRLTEALDYRPGDLAARKMLVRLLLDMDRVEEAQAQVVAARALAPADPRIALLDGWVAALGIEDPSSAREALSPYLQAHPADGEAYWVLGLAQLRAAQPEAPATLDDAIRHLSASRDPSHAMLLARAKAARFVASPRTAAALLDELEATYLDDPWVCLVLAWQYREGQNPRASALFARATEIEPEFGRAHFERGNYALDAGDGKRQTRESWRAYRALRPSGPREERVANLLKKMR